MTLEQIKAEIEGRQKSCIEAINVGYGNKDYECGCHDTYDEILEFLDELGPSWHEYPREKPTEKNGYVVSVVDESNGYCFTDASFYHPNLDRFEIDDVYQLHVYAWADLPKPYVKESDNDH